MIRSEYVQCTTCGHKYRIRYNVGGKFPQSASFFCKTCGKSITCGYGADRKIVLENIVVIEPDDNALVINLHPELAIDESRESDASYFPSIEFMAQNHALKDLVAFRKAQSSNVAYVNEWNKIAEDFRRLNEELWPLLRQSYGNDDSKTTQYIIQKAIDVAGIFLEGKWSALLRSVMVEVEKAKNHPNFSQLKVFLSGYLQEFLQYRMYQLMAQYHSVETELLSTLLEQKRGHEPKGLSSSAKWEKIERIYGDFYEIYGELVVILTSTNNLLARNNYEQFATSGFTLADYMKTDKAKRCANFSTNPGLASMGNFYDASLRNGTHHKTARINKAKQKIVLKVGKGGKSEKVWSFVEYIAYCNELYARCLILFIAFQKIIG